MQSMRQMKFGYMCSSLFNTSNELQKIGDDAYFAEIQVHDEMRKDTIKRIKNFDEFNGYFTIHGEGETDGKKKIKFCSSDELERRKYIAGTIHLYSLVYDALHASKIQRLILHPDTISKKNTRVKQLELLADSLVEIADHQHGVGMICIEPRGGDRQRKVLRINMEDIMALQNNLNSIGSNKVGLCIDVAQLFVAYGKSGAMQFLKDLKSIRLPVKEFHISDVLQKEKIKNRIAMEVGTGGIDWKSILPSVLQHCNNLLIETLGGIKVFQRSKSYLESSVMEKNNEVLL